MSENPDAPTPAPTPATRRPAAVRPTFTDEGVPYAWQVGDPSHLVNLSRVQSEARRIALHVQGKTYYHVGEDAEGRWIYRLDN